MAQPAIGNLGPPFVEQDVVALEVAVVDAAFVDVLEALLMPWPIGRKAVVHRSGRGRRQKFGREDLGGRGEETAQTKAFPGLESHAGAQRNTRAEIRANSAKTRHLKHSRFRRCS